MTCEVHVTHSLNNSVCAVEERRCVSSWKPSWHAQAVWCL